MHLHLMKRMLLTTSATLMAAHYSYGQVTVAGTTGFVAATVAGVAATVAGTGPGTTTAGTTAATAAATVASGATTGFVAATVAGTNGPAATVAVGTTNATNATTVAGSTVASGATNTTGFVAATVAGSTVATNAVNNTATTGAPAATVAATVAGNTSAATAAATVAGPTASTTGFVAATVASTVAGGPAATVAATVAGNTNAATAAATVAGNTSAANTLATVAATVAGNTNAATAAATVAGGPGGPAATVAATVAGTTNAATAAATVAGNTAAATAAATVAGGPGGPAATVAATVAGTTNAATAAATVAGGPGGPAATVAATVAGTTNAATAAATVAGGPGGPAATVAATVAGTTNAATAAATVAGNTAAATVAATVAGTTNAATAAATVAGTTNAATAAATVSGSTNAATVAATVSGSTNAATVAATVSGSTNAATVAATVAGSSTNAATVAATVAGSSSNTTAATVAATVSGNTNFSTSTSVSTSVTTTAGSSSSTGFSTGFSTATVGTTASATSSSATGFSSSSGSASAASSSSSSSSSSASASSSSSSSSTGGGDSSSSSSGFKEKEKNELKAKLKPLFHLNFDYGSYIVNLTPQFRNMDRSIVSYDFKPMASSDVLRVGDYRGGFQKTVYGSIEVGIGAQVQFWFDNATGVLKHFWGYVGVLPILGKQTESVRYVSTLDKAMAMNGRWEVPKSADSLDRWDTGDSITYVGRGGIIFSAGAGLGPVGIGVAKLAAGTWETYVEKVSADKAYVKMTRGKLENFSMFTNVSILTLALSDFKYADDGFSFLFDLSTEVGRKAYEDMIRGNVLASENFAKNTPRNLVERAPVVKVETFRSVSSGKILSKSLAIPIIWDKTYSKGRINSFTTSDLHINRNTARVHYGIFTDSVDSRFWFKHKETDFMFYGAKYSVENWDSKARMESMFGTYSYAFRHEQSNGNRLRKGIRELVKKTGLDTLMVSVPDRDLGYTGIEFNVNFSDENTMRLMMAAQRMSQDQFIDMSTDQISGYFRSNNDPYDYCMIDAGPCVYNVTKRTANAASKMYYALKSMYKYMNSDPKAFAAAYGEFGEGMAENVFTFRSAMRMAGPNVLVDYLIEGTYLSMYYRQWAIDTQGRWVAVGSPTYKGLPFDPATRHSQARGLILGNSEAGKLPQMTPVIF